MPAKVWKLMKGRWGGITARGKRITIVGSKEKAKKLAGLTSSKSRTTKSKTKTRKKVKRKLARRRRRRRGGGGKSLSRTLFKWIRVAALVGPGAVAFVKGNTMEEKLSYVLAKYTGYQAWDNRFNPAQLVEGYGPFLMAVLATYGIPKIAGIIRKM